MNTNFIPCAVRVVAAIVLITSLAASPSISVAQCWDIDFLSAIRDGDTKRAELLLKHGADANATHGEFAGYTPLMWAVWHGDVAMVKLLLKRGADAAANDGRDLIFAASQGRADVVKLLMDKGSDPNAKDDDGRTALMYAARKGHDRIVRLLLKRGARTNAKDREQRKAFMYAARNGHLILAKVLGAGKTKTTLESAARVGDYQGIKSLLKAGADADSRNKDGTPLLVWAAANGEVHVVKLLLEKGARVDIEDKNGWTALMWASRKGDVEIVELLKRHGAKGKEFKTVVAKTVKGEVLESKPTSLSIQLPGADAGHSMHVSVGLRTKFTPFRRPDVGEFVEVKYRTVEGRAIGEEVKIIP